MKNILVTLIITFAICNHTNAQFLKKLSQKAKETAERTIERKAEQKTEEATEKVMDSLFESKGNASKKNKNSNTSEDYSNDNEENTNDTSLLENIVSSSNASYEPQYIFPVTATIEVEDVSANAKKTTMKQGYGKQSLITEMESGNNPIIVDMKNQTAVMLDIKAGTAQVMSLKWMEKMMGSKTIEETSSNQPKVVKTGKSKQMNGYNCYEYNIFYEEGKINAWFAPDVTFDYQDYLRGMAKMFSKKAEENPSQLLNTKYGYVMEMTAYTKENKKQSSMKVIELNEKVRMITMKNFKIQKL